MHARHMAVLSHGFSVSTSVTYFNCIWFNVPVSSSATQRRTLERLVSISDRLMGMMRKDAGVYQRRQDFSQGGALWLYAK
jgi:hypothetical protein